jgi:hypothetical protein
MRRKAAANPPHVFVRRLQLYPPSVLGHCRRPLGTNLVEGINNKIKVIKRIAYGYRDDATPSKSELPSPDLGEAPNKRPDPISEPDAVNLGGV